jgi:hypothetical protein
MENPDVETHSLHEQQLRKLGQHGLRSWTARGVIDAGRNANQGFSKPLIRENCRTDDTPPSIGPSCTGRTHWST